MPAFIEFLQSTDPSVAEFKASALEFMKTTTVDRFMTAFDGMTQVIEPVLNIDELVTEYIKLFSTAPNKGTREAAQAWLGEATRFHEKILMASIYEIVDEKGKIRPEIESAFHVSELRELLRERKLKNFDEALFLEVKTLVNTDAAKPESTIDDAAASVFFRNGVVRGFFHHIFAQILVDEKVSAFIMALPERDMIEKSTLLQNLLKSVSTDQQEIQHLVTSYKEMRAEMNTPQLIADTIKDTAFYKLSMPSYLKFLVQRDVRSVLKSFDELSVSLHVLHAQTVNGNTLKKSLANFKQCLDVDVKPDGNAVFVATHELKEHLAEVSKYLSKSRNAFFNTKQAHHINQLQQLLSNIERLCKPLLEPPTPGMK